MEKCASLRQRFDASLRPGVGACRAILQLRLCSNVPHEVDRRPLCVAAECPSHIQRWGPAMKEFIGFVVALLLAWLAWQLAWPSHEHRFKLTLEFEADGKIYSGSGVLSSRAQSGPMFAGVPGGKVWISGDAIFVDLGPAGHVISIMGYGRNGTGRPGLRRLAIVAFDIPPCTKPFCEMVSMNSVTGSREIPLHLVPTLVAFDDLSDPSSLKLVRENELISSRGHPMKFHRAVVQITNESVTRHIHRYLPWLGNGEMETKAARALAREYPNEGGSIGGSWMFRWR